MSRIEILDLPNRIVIRAKGKNINGVTIGREIKISNKEMESYETLGRILNHLGNQIIKDYKAEEVK